MSLLEDIFLEDEAEEAAELERIVEGDEYDERPQSPRNSDDNSEKEDEAEEDKRRVDPTSGTKAKREIKNPRFVLNPARLTGPRGIQVIPEHFKDFKFKGKGNEKEDLDMVLKKLEHWAYRLYPKFQFEDCLKKIETLGKKRPVTVHLHKIRSDQLVTEETVVQQDSDDEPLPAPQEEDEFDKLLQQQIELARATPSSVRKPNGSIQTPITDIRSPLNLPSIAPKATSSPSISDEQRERMLLSRRLAEERRLARLKTNSGSNQLNADNETSDVTSHENDTEYHKLQTQNADKDTINVDMDYEIQDMHLNISKSKKNRPQVIDTSDSEDDYDKSRKNNEECNFNTLKQQNVKNVVTEFEINNTNIFIDKPKKNRPQVIDSDSSDSDSFEGTTVNHIAVDVHNAGSQVLNDMSETYEGNRQNIVLNETEVEEKEKGLNEILEKQMEYVDNDTVSQTESVANDKGVSEPQKESVDNETVMSEPQTESVDSDKVISEPQTESVDNDTVNSEPQTESVDSDKVISEPQTESVDNDTVNSEPQTENYTDFFEKQTDCFKIDQELSEKRTENVDNASDITENLIHNFQDKKHADLGNSSGDKENHDCNVLKPTEIVEELMDLDFSDDF